MMHFDRISLALISFLWMNNQEAKSEMPDYEKQFLQAISENEIEDEVPKLPVSSKFHFITKICAEW